MKVIDKRTKKTNEDYKYGDILMCWDDDPEKVYVAWVVECTKFAPPLLDSSWSLKTEVSKLDEPWQKTAGYGVVIGTNGLEVSKQIRKFEIQLVHQLGLSMDLDYQSIA